jgi:hypothetical protein
MEAFAAISRRWPNLPAREIQRIIDECSRRPLYVTVSTARMGSVEYQYWGAVRYRLEIGSAGLPVVRALHAAGRDRRSEAGAERDADATGLPWLPRSAKGGGAAKVVGPEFFA